jgi:hypothetical protein
MKEQTKLIKLADTLHSAIQTIREQMYTRLRNNLEDFCVKYSEITKDKRLLDKALQRGWFWSADRVRARSLRTLDDFSYRLIRIKESINADRVNTPELTDIYADLLQIDQELGPVKFDLKAATLSVITDPVNLDGYGFGPFEIRLDIQDIHRLYGESPYRIIALEPNCAGTDPDVTHPHVSSERLCEGDGYTSIRRAIEEGRLFDFFTIIISILNTYNPDSPYVSLDDWEGTSCYDCGYTVSGDECYYCEDCDRDFCSQCSTYCRMCDVTICLGCAYECPECGCPVCKHCRGECRECGETYCKGCLDNQGLCKQCQENRKENDNEQESTAQQTTQTASASV